MIDFVYWTSLHIKGGFFILPIVFFIENMVNTTSETFDTLFQSFEKSLDNFVPASSLLWWWTNSKFGVRVEVPSLGKEFSNGMNLGRDPEGFLFFNDIGDIDGEVLFDVYYNTVSDLTQRAFVIQFYNKGQTAARSFAKFLAKDPNKTVNYTLGSETGTWSDVSASSSAARITKTSTGNTWTLTIPSIHKQVTFSDNGSTTTSNHKRVDTLGQLTWKDINTITNGIYVDYKDGRIVFTATNEWSKDFNAFFIALETTESENPLGPYVVQAAIATWSNT